MDDIETIDVLEDAITIESNNSTGISNLSNYTEQDNSIELNGTESFVTIEEDELNEELNQITISAFIKPNYTSGSAEFAILSKENSFTLSLNNIITPEHLPKFSVFDGISWTEVIGSTQIEEWSHLVALIDHTTISLYINGTLEDTAQLSEPIFVSGDKLQLTTSDIMTTDSDLVIGAYISNSRGETTLSNHFSGSIDEILIYKEILNELQIDEIYSEFVEQLQFELENPPQIPIKIQNITSTLDHTEIIIGEPVNWIQTIESEVDILNIQVEIPADAENIQVEIIEHNEESLEISQEKMDIIESLPALESDKAERILLESVSMDKLDLVLQEDKDTKLVIINENATEYSLEFETPAPYTTEENNSNEHMFNKTVTVAHDSALHYTDVRSYSDLPENLVHDGIEFSLFWNINGTKTNVTNDPKFHVEFVDTNNNGILDRMFWIVPQLSAQVFEIIGSSSNQSSIISCQDVFLDFEGIPHGAPLSYINNLPQFKDNGITLIAPYDESGPFHTFIIFDSDESRTSDYDLEVNEGNIVIVPENDNDWNNNGIFDDPDDHAAGGIQVYEFDHPRTVKSFVFVDHDNNNFARATAFDVEGNVIKHVNIPNGGESSVQTITMNAPNTVRLEIEYHDSGALTQIDLSCYDEEYVILHGLIRDFMDSHPDFQYVIGDDDGIVNPDLGDGNGAEPDNPAHAKSGPTKTTTSAENFNQWYENVENTNLCQEYDVTLSPNNDGLFEFSDTSFFPIDGELFGNQGRQHNYHFTYEMRGTFEFGTDQTIQVNGDDDIWIFVNHKLIYDGGGVLPPRDSGLLEF
ncbi:MAG: LamG-like jellyroll fold domain-containing protein, partial [Candidatus Kariarchaeaceae archaeon]